MGITRKWFLVTTTSVLLFLFCGKILDKKQLRGGRAYLAHSFKVYSPALQGRSDGKRVEQLVTLCLSLEAERKLEVEL